VRSSCACSIVKMRVTCNIGSSDLRSTTAPTKTIRSSLDQFLVPDVIVRPHDAFDRAEKTFRGFEASVP